MNDVNPSKDTFFYCITNFPTFAYTLSNLIYFSVLSNFCIFSSVRVISINPSRICFKNSKRDKSNESQFDATYYHRKRFEQQILFIFNV